MYELIQALSFFDEPILYVICEMTRRCVFSHRDMYRTRPTLTHGPTLGLYVISWPELAITDDNDSAMSPC